MVSFANSPQPEPWRRRISRVSGKACTLSSAVFSGRGTASLLKNGRGPGSAFGGRGRPGISKMFANVFNELRSNVRDFSELALINNTNYFAANIEARAGFTLPKRPDAERFMSAADFRAALALLHERGVSANELHRINNQPRRWARALCGAGSGRGLARHPALDTARPK